MSKRFSEDYLDGYEAGLAFMLKSEREHQRIAAFGAIRRAAELARRVDCKCGCHGDLDAHAMRRVIRAAIGSEKQ